MELIFPTNPTRYQIWKDPSNNVTYKWTGYQWSNSFVNVSSLPTLPK